ncbi:hypothetical protein SRHO_G00128190 [Serrasalmus rhombeus]
MPAARPGAGRFSSMSTITRRRRRLTNSQFPLYHISAAMREQHLFYSNCRHRARVPRSAHPSPDRPQIEDGARHTVCFILPTCPPPPPPDVPPASFTSNKRTLTRWTAARQLNKGDVISSAASAKAHSAPRPRLVIRVVPGCLRSVRSERDDSGTPRAPQPCARLSQLLTPGRRDVIRRETPHINLWPLPVS